MSVCAYKKCDICGKVEPEHKLVGQSIFGHVYVTAPKTDLKDSEYSGGIDICPECYEKLPDYLRNCVKLNAERLNLQRYLL